MAAAAEYGLFDASGLREARARLTDALQHFADLLGTALVQTIDNATSVNVATYVSDDLAGVQYDNGQFTGRQGCRP